MRLSAVRRSRSRTSSRARGRPGARMSKGSKAAAPARPRAAAIPRSGAPIQTRRRAPPTRTSRGATRLCTSTRSPTTPACAQDDVAIESALARPREREQDAVALAYRARSLPRRLRRTLRAGAPAGLAAIDPFLEKVVQEIELSPAYGEGGLIAITFDRAPQSGPKPTRADAASPPPTRTSPRPRSRRHHHDHDEQRRARDDGRARGRAWARPARWRQGRPAADLEVCQARQRQRDRPVRPLLAAAQHRAALRAEAARLCRRRPACWHSTPPSTTRSNSALEVRTRSSSLSAASA